MATQTHFEIIEKIGSGGMGELFRARLFNQSGFEKIVVAKKVNKIEGSSKTKQLSQEASIQSLLNHPNICSIFDVREYEDEEYILIEYIDGQSIHDLLILAFQKGYKFTENFIWVVLKNTIHGLQYLHKSDSIKPSILHRDLSPHNIMIGNQGFIKIIDFGVSGFVRDNSKNSNEIGFKLRYLAPEVLNGDGYSEQSDLYALGVILFELTSGFKAFQGMSAVDQLNKNEKLDFSLISQRGYSDNLKKIIECLCEISVNNRYKAAEQVLPEIKTQHNDSVVMINELKSLSQFSLESTQTVVGPFQKKSVKKLYLKVISFLVGIILLAIFLIVFNKKTKPLSIKVNNTGQIYQIENTNLGQSTKIVGAEPGYYLSELGCLTAEQLIVQYPALLFDQELEQMLRQLNLNYTPKTFLFSVQNKIDQQKPNLDRISKNCNHSSRYRSLIDAILSLSKNIKKVDTENLQTFKQLQDVVLAFSTLNNEKYLEINHAAFKINETQDSQQILAAVSRIKEHDIKALTKMMILSLEEELFPQSVSECRDILDQYWIKQEFKEKAGPLFNVVLLPFPLNATIEAYDDHYVEFRDFLSLSESKFKIKGVCVYQRKDGELMEVSLRRLK